MSARLTNCPECGHRWPPGPEHALRGAGWLQGLSRSISPTNGDLDIHDGLHGNRFLRLEMKGDHEKWPLQKGQLWALQALAASEKWTVRILRGTTSLLHVHAVTARGVSQDGIRTHAEAVRRAVDAWLKGALWRDAEALLTAPTDIAKDHVCGWARVDGEWRCVQDHFASGKRPETSCGKVLPAFEEPTPLLQVAGDELF